MVSFSYTFISTIFAGKNPLQTSKIATLCFLSIYLKMPILISPPHPEPPFHGTKTEQMLKIKI